MLKNQAQNFILSSFERLDQRRIPYVVVRNVEELSNISTDVDIVVRKKDAKKFEDVLDQTCQEQGGSLVVRDIFLGIRQSVYFFPNSEAEPVCVGMDLKENMTHQGLISLSAEKILEGRRQWGDTWRPSYCSESAALLFHAILDKGWFREGYIERILELRDKDRDGFASVLRSAIRSSDAQWVECCLDKGAFQELLQRDRWIDSLLAKRPAKRWALWSWRMRHGLRMCKYAFMRRGALVALLGPDGVGKSTLVEHLRVALERYSFKVVLVYFGVRTPLLPTKRILRYFHEKKRVGKQRKPVSSKLPNSRTRWAYFFGWIHLLMDQLLRYWVYVRFPLARRRIVLCDRYPYDTVATHFPQGLHSLMDFAIKRLVPRPDLTIVLRGNPRDIFRRKPELSVPEIERVQKCYARLCQTPFYGKEVIVDRGPEEMAINLVWDVMVGFSKRNG